MWRALRASSPALAAAATATALSPWRALPGAQAPLLGCAEGPRRADRRPGQTMVLGLTGSIGMGKSTVSKWFQELGVPVDDADAVVHRLYGAGGAAVAPIKELFGETVLGEDGGVSRVALTKFVVGEANTQNLKKLEAIVFPLVDVARDEFIQAAARRGEPLVVLDIPLLFERGSEGLCDGVAVASAPAERQRERVLGRPGMTEAKFEAILAKQVPDAVKRAKADHVLDTGAPLAETRASVEALVSEYRRRVGAERRRPWLLAAGCAALLGLGSLRLCWA